MTGSSLRQLAWLLPVLVTVGLWFKLSAIRADNTALHHADTTPPAPEVAPPHPATPRLTAPVGIEHQDFDRLRQELAHLRQRIARRERQLNKQIAPTEGEAPPPPRLGDAFLPPEAWRDTGVDTPAALIETALWAGAGGDVQRMAALLAFEPDTLESANALFALLPPGLRPEHADGRDLLTLLSVDAVPLQPAKLAGEFSLPDGEHALVVQFQPPTPADATRPPLRHVRINARRDDATGSWRLVVPQSAVSRFATTLGLDP
ncbi:hypothetical protein [Synoicihabitans lomoniglobus]|uniref:Uncharacterized protein n=1 Tax=Synoicihabitans lomoniglobus TaxID=2909285 RepID=A0AAF0CP21_9BACT|nr:hypothetical protein [Opitutaceae bacterium LMO-M01]WED63259.1 hypothetical protein PXH66_13055 [Opitutaceae bacterium LMO-M01]